MDPHCPFVIEVDLPGGKQTVLALEDASEAIAALERTALEYPRSTVLLYINGRAVLVQGPTKPS